MAAYVYSDDRKNERPAGHLAGFRGVLHVDGYNGFKALAQKPLPALWNVTRSTRPANASTGGPWSEEGATEPGPSKRLLGHCDFAQAQPVVR
ncbi:MAG: IS66 family transposase [Janthinobacterium lividum]